jgi:hypothetical protein
MGEEAPAGILVSDEVNTVLIGITMPEQLGLLLQHGQPRDMGTGAKPMNREAILWVKALLTLKPKHSWR